GRPMSKSLGNVISPGEIIKQYGADILRMWVAVSDYGGDVRISPEILRNLTEAYRKVRNTLRYLLNNLTDFNPHKHLMKYEELEEIDRWAMHELQDVIKESIASYNSYEFYRVSNMLLSYCIGNISGVYLVSDKDRYD